MVITCLYMDIYQIIILSSLLPHHRGSNNGFDALHTCVTRRDPQAIRKLVSIWRSYAII